MVAEHMPGFHCVRNLLLEKHRVEYSFELGDVLIFNRYVFHKSCPLRSGPLTMRRAYVMRFVDAAARYNPELAQNHAQLSTSSGTENPTSFGLSWTDLSSGQPLLESDRIAAPI